MIAIYFIFGLLIGSFLNAALYRLHSGQSIVFDRSICPRCKHTLEASDLIPIFSFIFLRGKCRYCKKDISWQYPFVEFITGIVFVLFASQSSFQISEFLIFNLVISCILIFVAVFDWKHYLILDVIVIPASVLALIQLIYLSYEQHNFGLHSTLSGGIFGAIIISGFFAFQYYVSSGRWIGFGDVKFGILLGLLFGVGEGVMFLFLSYCLGAVVGVALISLGKKEMSGKLPFGTILGFSGIIMLLVGTKILTWYLGLIGL